MTPSGAERRRVIGLDIGTRRIGVAVSDELGIIASPETTITVADGPTGEGEAMIAITAIVQRFAAHRVVAGLPRNMKGERGVQAQWTERFVVNLRAALSAERVPVVLYDERLTSVEAARSLPQTKGGTRRKRADPAGRMTVDARAAALILQGYLDRRRRREDDLDGRGGHA